MSVFEPDRILDYADLFITTGNKPQFGKGNKTETSDADPFDEMMNEGKVEEQTKEKTTGGVVPESFKST
jgi:hypothetical protein